LACAFYYVLSLLISVSSLTTRDISVDKHTFRDFKLKYSELGLEKGFIGLLLKLAFFFFFDKSYCMLKKVCILRDVTSFQNDVDMETGFNGQLLNPAFQKNGLIRSKRDPQRIYFFACRE
jgi:hypothetical protein